MHHFLMAREMKKWTWLIAASTILANSAQAADYPLFPRSSNAPETASQAPKELPPIAVPANLQAPLPAPDGKPLRLVIPNINNEKPQAAEKSKEKVQKTASSETGAAQEPSAIKQAAHAIYQKAQNIWDNGVIMADWSNIPIVRTILKPTNVAFAPVPNEWNVASNEKAQPVILTNTAQNTSLATLAPAAGGDEGPVAAAEQPVVMQAIAPIAPIVPQTTATPDTSEPAPTLSSQSKTIANKIPSVTDKTPEKKLTQKVDIDHVKDAPDVLNTDNKLSASNEALGVKVNPPRAKFDVNYELDRAYSALIAGKSDVAIQIYEDILTSDPKNKDALFGLASTYHRLGQLDMARGLYGKLLQLDPKHRDGLNNFLVLLADEAPQEALEQMERLETQNPDFSPIPAQMAIIYQKLGDREKAIDKMYRALAVSPENITYRYNLAIMLDTNGKYEEAGKLYAQLLESNARGEQIPGDAAKIQQRLTFIRSNITK